MTLVDRLLASDEPSIRLQVRRGLEAASKAEVTELQEQIRRSPRVATLLSERKADGTISAHAYRAKWYGAHWVLVTLAELGYPAEDKTLIPLREQMLDWLFSDDYLNTLGPVRGLPRLHGSIEGNALWAMLRDFDAAFGRESSPSREISDTRRLRLLSEWSRCCNTCLSQYPASLRFPLIQPSSWVAKVG